MTNYDANWVAAEEAKRKWMAENGMYSEEEEHSSCGVGLVVSIDGKKSRKVVEAGIKALKAIWHRGAVDADGKTGDGAGIHVDLPVRFFDDAIAASGHKVRPNRLAVGMIFLPRTDLGNQPLSKRRDCIVEDLTAGRIALGLVPAQISQQIMAQNQLS